MNARLGLLRGIGIFRVKKNRGVQDKQPPYWSGVLAPLYPEGQTTAEVDFLTTCYLTDYLDLLAECSEGDLLLTMYEQTPVLETSNYDGAVRGKLRMRILHCERFPMEPPRTGSSLRVDSDDLAGVPDPFAV